MRGQHKGIARAAFKATCVFGIIVLRATWVRDGIDVWIGSRVLRNFMRDRITQILPGNFVSTFIYGVLVVRAIRGSNVAGGFVPAISVTVAIALSLTSLILLIYFIHHVSTSIRASKIVQVIAADMEGAIPRLCPETGEPPEDWGESAVRRERGQVAVAISTSGYLQTVDLIELLAIATQEDLIVELTIKPGEHLVKGCPLPPSMELMS
jgi:uncharacterized membrane protein